MTDHPELAWPEPDEGRLQSCSREWVKVWAAATRGRVWVQIDEVYIYFHCPCCGTVTVRCHMVDSPGIPAPIKSRVHCNVCRLALLKGDGCRAFKVLLRLAPRDGPFAAQVGSRVVDLCRDFFRDHPLTWSADRHRKRRRKRR